jgi:GT2 family glycosyltransferase
MTSESTRILIGILAYSDPIQLQTTLESVKNLNTSDVTTLLYQNGLPDQEFDELIEHYPWISFQRNNKNIGAAGGRNKLIDYALKQDFDYLLFLDSDATLDSNALNYLLKIYPKLQNPGLLSCLIYNLEEPEKVHSAGGEIVKKPYYHLHHFTTIPNELVIKQQIVITTAAIISCERLKVLKKLDERFFVYWEDVDWCLQLIEQGSLNYISSQAIGYHSSRRSRFHPAIAYYFCRNQFLLYQKNFQDFTSFMQLRIITNSILQCAKRILAFTPLGITVFFAELAGYLDFYFKKYGIAPAWLRRKPDQFLEQKIYKAIFKPSRVSKIKKILNPWA